MNFRRNKFLIYFLIFAVVAYGFSFQIARASWFSDFFSNPFGFLTTMILAPAIIPIITPLAGIIAPALLVNYIASPYLGPAGTTIVNILAGETLLGPGTISSFVLPCALDIICPPGGANILAIAPTNTDCTFKIPLTFYNQTFDACSYFDEATGQMVANSVDESNRQVAIYRFILPSSSSLQDLAKWVTGSVPNAAGNGWAAPPWYGFSGYTTAETAAYHISSNDQSPYFLVSYSGQIINASGQPAQFCSGNVCSAVDLAAPPDSYIIYIAKILGDYDMQVKYTLSGPEGESISYGCESKPNKFFNTDNSPNVVQFPDLFHLGNVILGPFQTPSASSCPPPPPIIEPPPIAEPPVVPPPITPPTTPPPTTPDFYPLSSNNIYATMSKGSAADSTETTITIVPVNSFASNISLSVVSSEPALPEGTTYSFSRPNLVSSLFSSGSIFKVHLGPGLITSQTYSIVIKATGGGLTRTSTVLLNANIKNPQFIEF